MYATSGALALAVPLASAWVVVGDADPCRELGGIPVGERHAGGDARMSGSPGHGSESYVVGVSDADFAWGFGEDVMCAGEGVHDVVVGAVGEDGGFVEEGGEGGGGEDADEPVRGGGGDGAGAHFFVGSAGEAGVADVAAEDGSSEVGEEEFPGGAGLLFNVDRNPDA